jgi:hypothetical protein
MYTLFYNKECPDCEQRARFTSKLDWLNRLRVSTEIPPTGELEKGEIVVISDEGNVFTHGYAQRVICLNIPLFFIFGLILLLPPVVKAASKGKVGCNGESCDINT